jgi:hypothetical protein
VAAFHARKYTSPYACTRRRPACVRWLGWWVGGVLGCGLIGVVGWFDWWVGVGWWVGWLVSFVRVGWGGWLWFDGCVGWGPCVLVCWLWFVSLVGSGQFKVHRPKSTKQRALAMHAICHARMPAFGMPFIMPRHAMHAHTQRNATQRIAVHTQRMCVRTCGSWALTVACMSATSPGCSPNR